MSVVHDAQSVLFLAAACCPRFISKVESCRAIATMKLLSKGVLAAVLLCLVAIVYQARKLACLGAAGAARNP